MPNGNDVLLVRHSRYNNFVIHYITDIMTLFRSATSTYKEYSKKYLSYVNNMNSSLYVYKVFYDTNNEGNKVDIGFNAIYVGVIIKRYVGNS